MPYPVPIPMPYPSPHTPGPYPSPIPMLYSSPKSYTRKISLLIYSPKQHLPWYNPDLSPPLCPHPLGSLHCTIPYPIPREAETPIPLKSPLRTSYTRSADCPPQASSSLGPPRIGPIPSSQDSPPTPLEHPPQA
ncbi:uncharacterized protein [Palaemon carinicauda]|uniref:uncharacterized protein n=1 Tax=Palaemon carinicauda TaxID=392227 RepID=UPI0035B5C016